MTDKEKKKLFIQYFSPQGAGLQMFDITHIKNAIPSIPPTGSYQVTNLYVDPNTQRLVVEYDDTPYP